VQNTGGGARVAAARPPPTGYRGHLRHHHDERGGLQHFYGCCVTGTAFAQNSYNFAPLNYFMAGERYRRRSRTMKSPAIKPYLEFMFMDDHTLAQIAPSGDFGNTLTLNCDNPFLNTAPGSGNNGNSEQATICNPNNLINGFLGNFPLAVGAPFNPNPGNLPVTFFDARGNTYNQAFFQLLRRNTEGGPRVSDLTHTSYRGVIGTKGDLSKVFSYDAYYQYGKTDY
jgi:hypothetical protein